MIRREVLARTLRISSFDWLDERKKLMCEKGQLL